MCQLVTAGMPDLVTGVCWKLAGTGSLQPHCLTIAAGELNLFQKLFLSDVYTDYTEVSGPVPQQ